MQGLKSRFRRKEIGLESILSDIKGLKRTLSQVQECQSNK